MSDRFASSGVSADAMPTSPTSAAPEASSDSGAARSKRPPPTRPGYNLLMSPDERHRWMPLLLVLVALALVPWTLWLTFSLPSRHLSQHYDIAWIGFDVALAAAFGATAWAAFRSPRWLVALAATTGTMLVCDAWFDVVTASGSAERLEAVAEAALAELPLAAICAYIVYDTERFRDRIRHLRPPTPAARRAALRALAEESQPERRGDDLPDRHA